MYAYVRVDAHAHTQTHLGLLDRDQLLHGLGLNLHLFERMLGVEELAVNLVRGEETYTARERTGHSLRSSSL